MRLLIPLLWLACTSDDRPSDDVTPSPDDTFVRDVDTERPADTEPGDTEPDDSEPDDTEATDSDDSDADSDLPVDPTPQPPDLGRGFVDLTTAVYAAWPRFVDEGDRATRDQPDLTSAHLVDLDGDELPEVVIIGTSPQAGAPTAHWVLRYDPATESLAPDAALTARLAGLDGHLLGLMDIDGDGLIDAIGGRRESVPQLGVAGGGFVAGLSGGSYGGLYHGAVVDIDDDGLSDVMLDGGGCGEGPWRVALATGPRRWETRLDLVDWAVAGSPYVVGLAWFDGEKVTMSLGGPCDPTRFQAGFARMVGTDADDLPRYVDEDLIPADAMYKLDPSNPGRPISARRPMGAAVSDLDGDGDVDLAIASTYERILVFETGTGLPFDDATFDAAAILPLRWPDARSRPGQIDIQKPWGIAAIDVDLDDQLDLVMVNGGDFGDWNDDSLGEFIPLLYIQRDGVFHEWTAGTGLDFVQDGRGLAIGDLDRDGRPDLLIGGNGSPPRVLLNRVETGRPPIGVRLVGNTSNTAAHGALVRIEDDGVLGPAFMIGGVVSMGAVSEPIAFGTTGPDGVADAVHITWPSGYTQVVRDLAADRVHTITEPNLVSLTPSTRHAPADGVSTVTVRVVPRDEAGRPRAATVAVRLRAGTGTLVGVPTAVGTGWEQTVQAPTSPGWATFEIDVDGVTLQVRPRVWWD